MDGLVLNPPSSTTNKTPAPFYPSKLNKSGASVSPAPIIASPLSLTMSVLLPTEQPIGPLYSVTAVAANDCIWYVSFTQALYTLYDQPIGPLYFVTAVAASDCIWYVSYTQASYTLYEQPIGSLYSKYIL